MKRMGAIFHWNEPFQDIQNHFLNTSLRPLFETYAYTPIILEFDYFACLLRCIIHQQINLKFATISGVGKKNTPFFSVPYRFTNCSVNTVANFNRGIERAEV